MQETDWSVQTAGRERDIQSAKWRKGLLWPNSGDWHSVGEAGLRECLVKLFSPGCVSCAAGEEEG